MARFPFVPEYPVIVSVCCCVTPAGGLAVTCTIGGVPGLAVGAVETAGGVPGDGDAGAWIDGGSAGMSVRRLGGKYSR